MGRPPRLVFACSVGLIVVGVWLGCTSRGEPPTTLVQQKVAAKPTKLFFGVSACGGGGCHSSPGDPLQKVPLLCDCNEEEIWSKQDKHNYAAKVLQGERARQMAKLLGIKGDLAKETSCIGCHGVLVENPELIHKPSFNVNDGVSCVACHGAYEEWVSQHGLFIKREKWRALSRQQKEEEFGMRDLWDPRKRATLCASCHIGNTAERKVVTHAMYAAGHPPLPGIEMATFSETMPRHWKYLAEKKPEVQKLLEYDATKGNLERTQLVVVAGLVSFRETMELLASQAIEGNAAKDAEKRWPELAQFDCYACHHDLKSDSWRQKRGYSGKPGRPSMRPWSIALIDLGVMHAAHGDPAREKALTDQMNDQMKELAKAFSDQPFGDPLQVAAAAKKMSRWTDKLLDGLEQTNRFDRSAAERLLADLGKISKHRLVDFDSARQITWAFRTIHDELHPKNAPNPERDRLLKTLELQLKLDLPHGRVEISKDYLKDAFEKLNAFDPARFTSTFEQLILNVSKK